MVEGCLGSWEGSSVSERGDAVIRLVEAAKERHWHPHPDAVPGIYGIWGPDMTVGNWCGCGRRFCRELLALDALTEAVAVPG